MILATYLTRDNWSYVVVTSPFSASILVKAFKEEEAGSPLKLRVASIGSMTSSILVEGGITPIFEASCANAETLSEELPLYKENTILYPTSSLATETIEVKLRKRGFKVTRLNTYTTSIAKWDIDTLAEAKRATLVTFASPSAVKVGQQLLFICF